MLPSSGCPARGVFPIRKERGGEALPVPMTLALCAPLGVQQQQQLLVVLYIQYPQLLHRAFRSGQSDRGSQLPTALYDPASETPGTLSPPSPKAAATAVAQDEPTRSQAGQGHGYIQSASAAAPNPDHQSHRRPPNIVAGKDTATPTSKANANKDLKIRFSEPSSQSIQLNHFSHTS